MAILDITADFRTDLIRREAEAERELMQRYIQVRHDIDAALSDVLDRIEAAREAGEEPGVSFLQREAQYRRLLDQIDDEIDRIASDFGATVERLRSEALDMGSELAERLMLDQGVTNAVRLPNQEVAELAGRFRRGSPLDEILSKLGPEAREQVERRLIAGVVSGHNPAQIAREISNALGGNLSRAMTIARTEQITAYRNAALLNYRQFPGVIRGWIWTAAVSSSPPPCFPAGTMVTTLTGAKAIERVTAGELVLTHRGRYRRVKAVSKTPHYGKMVELQINGQRVVSTLEHPFYVLREGSYQWVEARELVEGDRVVVEQSLQLGHDLSSRAVVQSLITQADNAQPTGYQPFGLASIPLADRLLSVPVGTVDFYDGVEMGEIEVNRRAQSTNLTLLLKRDIQRLKALTNRLFRRRLASKAPIAGERTESILRRGWQTAKLLATRLTDLHNRGVGAGGGAIDLRWPLPRAKTLVATRTRLRESRISSALITTVLDRWSGCWLTTFRAKAGRLAVGSYAALMRTVFPLAVLVQNAECYPAVGTFSISTRAVFPTSGLAMWVRRLVGGIASLRAEFTIALSRPSGGDGEGLAALSTDTFNAPFHVGIITSAAVQTQRIYQYVYNLEVEEDESYIANGFVVHNCPVCTANHGRIFRLSQPFGSHPGCRCSPAPYTGRRLEFPTGDQWFAGQPEAAQRQILGPAAFNAYQDGAVSLSDFAQLVDDDDWGPQWRRRSLGDILGSDADRYFAELRAA